MEEKELANKLMTLKTHESTLNFTIENFEKTHTRFSAILDE